MEDIVISQLRETHRLLSGSVEDLPLYTLSDVKRDNAAYATYKFDRMHVIWPGFTKSVAKNLSYIDDCELPHRSEIVSRVFELLDWSHICVAGGYLSKLLMGESGIQTDIDLFVYGLSSEEECNEFVRTSINTILTFLQAENSEIGYYMTTTENVINLYIEIEYGETQLFQFVARSYTNLAEIVYGFDMGSSGICYNGELYFSLLGKFAYATDLNIVDHNKRSTTYEYRLMKYFYRGFGIVFPLIDRYSITGPAVIVKDNRPKRHRNKSPVAGTCHRGSGCKEIHWTCMNPHIPPDMLQITREYTLCGMLITQCAVSGYFNSDWPQCTNPECSYGVCRMHNTTIELANEKGTGMSISDYESIATEELELAPKSKLKELNMKMGQMRYKQTDWRALYLLFNTKNRICGTYTNVAYILSQCKKLVEVVSTTKILYTVGPTYLTEFMTCVLDLLSTGNDEKLLNLLVKVLETDHKGCKSILKWITRDPGTQITSTRNPIFTSKEAALHWYNIKVKESAWESVYM